MTGLRGFPILKVPTTALPPTREARLRWTTKLLIVLTRGFRPVRVMLNHPLSRSQIKFRPQFQRKDPELRDFRQGG